MSLITTNTGTVATNLPVNSSSTTMNLLFNCSTLGDRSFPVAASRACTDCLRLSELRRHLCLFARSWRRFFSRGALINFSSLDTHYSVNVFKLAPYSARLRHISMLTVKCHCNVFLRYSVTIIFAFLIIIIINNNWSATGHRDKWQSTDCRWCCTHSERPFSRDTRTSQQPAVAVAPLSLIHIWRCRRSYACRSRWSPYH